MTNRELIKKRARIPSLLLIGSFLGIILSLKLLAHTSYAWVAALPALLFALSFVYLHKFINCPQCQAPIGAVISNIQVPWASPCNYCPSCGASLDDPDKTQSN
jgi:hypothetical protein